MLRLVMLSWLPMIIVGCGYSEEVFQERYAQAACDWWVDCWPETYADVEGCESEFANRPQWKAECTYDGIVAQYCVRDLEDLECPGATELPEFPSSCDHVYIDCGLS